MDQETTNDKAEQTNFSTEVKSSLVSLTDSTPKNIALKSEATGMPSLIEPNQVQMTVIYEHFTSIGADNQLLSNHENEQTRKKRNRAVLQKWFQTLVIQNDRFPRDIPVAFVLDRFFTAVLQKKVTLKGYNLLAHIRAYHEWMDKYKNDLRSAWWSYQNPGERPKALPDVASMSEEESQQSDKERAQMIKKMYGADQVPESLQKYLTPEED